MPYETRVGREGTLRWVQAGSGTGGAVATGWITASGATTGLLGFVEAGFNFNQQFTLRQVYDRGRPSHQKLVQQGMIPVKFTVRYGITADYPQFALTASGFSLPMVHLEFKEHDTELAGKDVPFTGTGIYHQFHNVPIAALNFTEAAEGNTLAFDMMAVALKGPTGSGYLS